MNDFLFAIPRFLHVGAAIVLVGGSAFMRFALMPAATATLSDADHAALRARIMDTWRKFVFIGIALLILSGAINYTRAILHLRSENLKDPLYHALMGTKILLALGVFFLASALVGRSAGLEKFRKEAKKWLLINLLLASVIVAISGYLRVRGTKSAVEAQKQSAT